MGCFTLQREDHKEAESRWVQRGIILWLEFPPVLLKSYTTHHFFLTSRSSIAWWSMIWTLGATLCGSTSDSSIYYVSQARYLSLGASASSMNINNIIVSLLVMSGNDYLSLQV